MNLRIKIVTVSGLLLVVIIASYFLWPEQPVDFNTQVKPILNRKCISCHGGVKRESDYSLLFRVDALAKAESGNHPIVPGKASESELIKRILSDDPEVRMPYKKDPLTNEEINILKKWINQGAPWGDHWAYVSVQQQQVPARNAWTKNDVDAFILDKLKEQQLNPSPPADKRTLLRRVSLDLIGMPADESLRKKFLADDAEFSYEVLVDSLLSSPHYGERWASVWMDLARYADTKGYERDDSRTIWRYRDWLIHAFNKDMPYDQFILEQLAGDLLDNPTDEQYIATAFHRNTMTNDEGGTDNEEFRVAAVLDRVNTTWEVLLGTSFACVQCHTHPYDPFLHKEYYQFTAFFNNTRDEDTYADYPLLRHYEPKDSEELNTIVQWVEKNYSSAKAKEVYTFARTGQPAINSLTADDFVNSELSDTKWLVFRNNAISRLKGVDLSGKNKLIYRYIAWFPGGIWTIRLDTPDGPILKSIRANDTKGKWTITSFDFDEVNGVHDLYFTYSNPNLKNPEASGMLFDWFYFTDRWDTDPKISSSFHRLIAQPVSTTPVLIENPLSMHRTTQVFERGNWLVKGEAVEPGVPASMNPFPADAPKNRLGLARWMTDPANPLTARTIVNRIWEQLFGVGLAETVEDLGTQGIPPTHPELLDHLSWKLMHEYRWHLKPLIREIVMSATYRQDSYVTPEVLEKDPYNKYYARAPRVRLSAEQLRDQALAVSGLLSKKMFGPSVMPWQPPGIWKSPWNGQDWKTSEGDDQYRRAIYTYWKRTAPYPAMITFDGTSREVCASRRIRTNTPLQALVTLNDSVYVEAAHQLAKHMQTRLTLREQLASGYEAATGNLITDEKRQVLEKLYINALQHYEEDVMTLTSQQQSPSAAPQLMAMKLVASALLNLDEVVTKN